MAGDRRARCRDPPARPTRNDQKKSASNKVARAAAAAAAAAVTASTQNDDKDVLLNWGGDDDDEEEDTADEVLEGLEQIDEESAGGVVWWELYCSSPLEKAGQIKKLSTPELKASGMSVCH